MSDFLKSNWSVSELYLTAGLSGYERVDDGTDLLAFRVTGSVPYRFAYIYLYGPDPDSIYFDLEDESAETDEWDNAVVRGSVHSSQELFRALAEWLRPRRLDRRMEPHRKAKLSNSVSG